MTQQHAPAAQRLWWTFPLLPLTWVFSPDTFGIAAVALKLVVVVPFVLAAVDTWRSPDPALSARKDVLLAWFLTVSAVAATVFGSLELYYLWRADQFR